MATAEEAKARAVAARDQLVARLTADIEKLANVERATHTLVTFLNEKPESKR